MVPVLTLLKSLALSVPNNCSQLWSPLKKSEIQSLELVQKSFVQKISGMHTLLYQDQLKSLKLYSLELRRERYVLIYIWKILEGLVPNISDTNGIRHTWRKDEGVSVNRHVICF